jgi:predicted amidohydrolase YtcJ
MKILSLVLFATLIPSAPAAPVDLLLMNGNIYTGAPDRPKAEAVAIDRGRIAFVGSTKEAERFRADARQVIDLAGKTVLPGLNDAHMHLNGVGFRELSFDLEGTKGIPDLRERLRARLAAVEPKKWIVGRGWIETHWTPAAFPTARDLDDLSPDNPVVLKRSDGHALVANSIALRLARIDRSTPNPPGGEILRYPDSGEATGMLVDEAMGLVNRIVPSPTQAETERALITGAQREASLGWTGIQIAGHSLAEAELVRRLVSERKIRIRIYDAVSAPGADAEELVAAGPVLGESDGRYTRRGLKFYMDGALGSRGAALLAPYSDYDSKGLLMHEQPARLLPLLEEALRRGIQVETHAIGDRGNRTILDLYEQAFQAVPVAERRVAQPRWRVEHAQILSPVDLPRFAQLGVIASMQPSHAIGDLYFAPKRLGAGSERLAGSYAWQSLLKSGAVIAAGSDAPVERGEPMIEFYAAVARRGLDGFADADWHLEQRMTREQALHALTVGPAYAAFEESERGTIEAGKRADFTILSADIMRIPEKEILTTRCLLTIVGGEVVYATPDQP